MDKIENFVEQIIEKLKEGNYKYQDKSFEISLNKTVVTVYIRLYSSPVIAYWYISLIRCCNEGESFNINPWDFGNEARWRLDEVAENVMEMEEETAYAEEKKANKKQIVDSLTKILK